jgi:hypothetical protein
MSFWTDAIDTGSDERPETPSILSFLKNIFCPHFLGNSSHFQTFPLQTAQLVTRFVTLYMVKGAFCVLRQPDPPPAFAAVAGRGLFDILTL